ncbi:SEC14-like protein 2 [Trichonephila inaurata madagascariensis]|uniref:SEC14-like protein 2 n=1 Tax=Trichonephila inaurata madagascariensis TaxID=2747483 RepID=A0A8X6YGS2_9ARAC|nr:SEC14-like protein 2 [Trichonephila inaurata madagascariensis]
MAWLDKLSLEQKEVMEELKRRTMHDMTPKTLEDESLFYRFCKARDFVLEDAEAMLRKHIVWRVQFQVDSILTHYKPPEVVDKYTQFHFIGYDKEASVIRYVDYGNADLKGLFNSAKTTEYVKYGVYLIESDFERMKQRSKEIGKLVTNATYIFNFENLTFAKATHKKNLEALLAFAKAFQDNYPERIKRIFFINVSFYFSLAFNVVKSVLASAVLQKIRCYSADDDWKTDLLEIIDADVLPAFLGGNRTDPDGNPRCKTLIKPAEMVPEKYYFKNSEKKLCKSLDAKKLIITRLSKEEWTSEVKEEGSYLEWEFETKSKDIAFAIYFQEKSSNGFKTIEVIPKQKIDTCYEPEKGFLKCDRAGIYVVVFDNSYSWIYSKELYYRIKITSPKDVYID